MRSNRIKGPTLSRQAVWRVNATEVAKTRTPGRQNSCCSPAITGQSSSQSASTHRHDLAAAYRFLDRRSHISATQRIRSRSLSPSFVSILAMSLAAALRCSEPSSVPLESRCSPRIRFCGGKRLICGNPAAAAGSTNRQRLPRRFECDADVGAKLADEWVAGPDDATARGSRKIVTGGSCG